MIHPVFHVSQLKPFLSDYTPVYSELPSVPDLSTVTPVPAEILKRRLVRKGNAATPQVLIKWAHVPASYATWEDYYVVKSRYPDAALWEEETAKGGDSVTHPTQLVPDSESQGLKDLASGPTSDEGPSYQSEEENEV
uniref:Uncharacterized protein n=1 Tax=Avena sativa TaxID=4498 RepID=A0ACD5XLJ6_AVESA